MSDLVGVRNDHQARTRTAACLSRQRPVQPRDLKPPGFGLRMFLPVNFARSIDVDHWILIIQLLDTSTLVRYIGREGPTTPPPGSP
ncbi:hypothetical protein QFZ49_004574 [Streptomyces turgidiscabies]|uniref:Transposase n=1 Tax=Streptomyces turgidiscabies TaxID=85558 RepID=A0ABU0RRN4_9ACTN|nr:hypothetical protein [Streptomyces turgidiscabies]